MIIMTQGHNKGFLVTGRLASLQDLQDGSGNIDKEDGDFLNGHLVGKRFLEPGDFRVPYFIADKAIFHKVFEIGI